MGHSHIAFRTDDINAFMARLMLVSNQPFFYEPCHCSRGVASIIERIDLGFASNLMRVLISLTASIRLL